MEPIGNSYNMDTRALAHLLHEGAKCPRAINEPDRPCYNWLVAIVAELSLSPSMYRTNLTNITINTS